jgi:hypothetical protein
MYRADHRLWAVWVIVFTPRHCERSFRHHRAKLHAEARKTNLQQQ